MPGERPKPDEIIAQVRAAAAQEREFFGDDCDEMVELYGAVWTRVKDPEAKALLTDILTSRLARFRGGFRQVLDINPEWIGIVHQLGVPIFNRRAIQRISMAKIKRAISNGKLETGIES
jgi:hypothetical protein